MAGGQGACDHDSLALRDTTLSSGYFSLGLLYTRYPSVKKNLKNTSAQFLCYCSD